MQARLDAPFTQINETATAIDMRADADFQATFGTGPGQCVQAAGAPDLTSSFHVPGAYPTLGGTTPSGQPYGLGLVISTSAFNQLLSSMTECGLLNQELHEIDLGGTVVPVTPGVLSFLVPQFAKVSPTADVFIRVDPQFAPFLTDDPSGPGGATAEMRLADLRISFVQNAVFNGTPIEIDMLTLGVEAPLGLSMAFDPAAGQLAPTITPPSGSEVDHPGRHQRHRGGRGGHRRGLLEPLPELRQRAQQQLRCLPPAVLPRARPERERDRPPG